MLLMIITLLIPSYKTGFNSAGEWRSRGGEEMKGCREGFERQTESQGGLKMSLE